MCFSTLAGCAVHYYDAETGVEHLVGFGHLTLKRPAADSKVNAWVVGVESVGVSVGGLGEPRFFNVGVHRHERIMIYDENTALCLERPLGGGLFTVVIGSDWPESLKDSDEPQDTSCGGAPSAAPPSPSRNTESPSTNGVR